MADTPKSPTKAKEVEHLLAGEVEEVKPLQGEKGQYTIGSQEVEDTKTEEEAAPEEETHKITIKLQNDQKKAVGKMPSGGSVKFRIKAGGTTYEGSLDDQGKAEVNGLPEGSCEVCFPEIDSSEWKKV